MMFSILRRNSRKTTICLSVSTGLFATTTIAFTILLAICDSIFLKVLFKQLLFVPGSTMFETWSSNTEGGIVSFYLFNVTNAKDVLLGKAPQLEEVGPYVYQQYYTRSNISFSAEKPPRTMFYKESEHFRFIPERSLAESGESNIVTPDLLHAYKRIPGNGLLDYVVKTTTPFVRLTPHETIWGYKYFGYNIGILGMLNSSVEDIGVDTGAYGIDEIGQVRSRGGEKFSQVWEQEDANIFRGTMGIINKPGLDENSTILLYVPNICRPIEFQSKGRTQSRFLKDFELQMFTFKSKDPATDWIERMYCNSKEPCPPIGMIAMAPCLKAKDVPLPVYTSFPLFLNTDPRAYNRLSGLRQPNVSEHETYLKVEPTTGITLEAYLRIQFSLYMANIDETYGAMAGPYYMPILWMSMEHCASKSIVEQFRDMILQVRKMIPIILFVICMVSGIVTLVLLQALLAILWWKNSQTTESFLIGYNKKLFNLFVDVRSSLVLQRLISVVSGKSGSAWSIEGVKEEIEENAQL